MQHVQGRSRAQSPMCRRRSRPPAAGGGGGAGAPPALHLRADRHSGAGPVSHRIGDDLQIFRTDGEDGIRLSVDAAPLAIDPDRASPSASSSPNWSSTLPNMPIPAAAGRCASFSSPSRARWNSAWRTMAWACRKKPIRTRRDTATASSAPWRPSWGDAGLCEQKSPGTRPPQLPMARRGLGDMKPGRSAPLGRQAGGLPLQIAPSHMLLIMAGQPPAPWPAARCETPCPERQEKTKPLAGRIGKGGRIEHAQGQCLGTGNALGLRIFVRSRTSTKEWCPRIDLPPRPRETGARSGHRKDWAATCDYGSFAARCGQSSAAAPPRATRWLVPCPAQASASWRGRGTHAAAAHL